MQRSVLLVVLLVYWSNAQNTKLPDGFFVGFATASYQVEGAWNEDGKGESTWDRFTHTHQDVILDGSNGDVAADQYHKFAEDIHILKELRAQTYRLSLSWARILPDGQANTINQKGVDYYNTLIDGLLAENINPLVTLFHWDLPQRRQDLGGWANPIMAQYFEEYARVAFTLFGDRVKQWITFNEPLQFCKDGYGSPGVAPAVNMSGIADYLCAHTVIYSHARAWHLYDDSFRPTQNGIIGITLNGGSYEPANSDPDNITAAETGNAFEIGWFANPIFSAAGDYPPIMREVIDANSASEGRLHSRLPKWDDDTVAYIRGTYDFFGMNHYTTTYAIKRDQPQGEEPSWERDRNIDTFKDPSWPGSASSWLKVVPWGIRKHLNYIKDKYNNPTVIITENGFSDRDGLVDDDRINYYSTYLEEVLNAIYDDGCNVIGYTAWSLLDNFEWSSGYTERFGIIHVDFEDSNRTRTYKKSASYFKELIITRTLPEPINGTWTFEGFY